jgi:hypothetical protein
VRQIGGCIEGCQRPSDTTQRDRESTRIFYVNPVSARDPRSQYEAGRHSNFHEWHHFADDLSEYCLHNLSYGSGDFGVGRSHLSGP